MRISDWSSDVCSSDLGVGVREALRGDQHQPVEPHGLERPRGRADVARVLGADQHDADAVGGGGIEVHVQMVNCAAGPEPAPFFSLPIPACARSCPRCNNPLSMSWSRRRAPAATSCCRSEEHTSELQSLMRISYAVFCLKKKKKTT